MTPPKMKVFTSEEDLLDYIKNELPRSKGKPKKRADADDYRVGAITHKISNRIYQDLLIELGDEERSEYLIAGIISMIGARHAIYSTPDPAVTLESLADATKASLKLFQTEALFGCYKGPLKKEGDFHIRDFAPDEDIDAFLKEVKQKFEDDAVMDEAVEAFAKAMNDLTSDPLMAKEEDKPL